MTQPPAPGSLPRKPRHGATQAEQPGGLNRDAARRFALAAAHSLIGDKCEDVVVLDVADLTTVTACLVIATGTSDRQMRSALRNLNATASEHGTKALRVSADDNATWLLADFVDVVVHLFEPNARAYYDLESLWDEGERLAASAP